MNPKDEQNPFSLNDIQKLRFAKLSELSGSARVRFLPIKNVNAVLITSRSKSLRIPMDVAASGSKP